METYSNPIKNNNSFRELSVTSWKTSHETLTNKLPNTKSPLVKPKQKILLQITSSKKEVEIGKTIINQLKQHLGIDTNTKVTKIMNHGQMNWKEKEKRERGQLLFAFNHLEKRRMKLQKFKSMLIQANPS